MIIIGALEDILGNLLNFCEHRTAVSIFFSNSNSRSRSRALESRKFGHFQRLSPPPFLMGLANDHGFLN